MRPAPPCAAGDAASRQCGPWPARGAGARAWCQPGGKRGSRGVVVPDGAERGDISTRRHCHHFQVPTVERLPLNVVVPLPALMVGVWLVGRKSSPRGPAPRGQLVDVSIMTLGPITVRPACRLATAAQRARAQRRQNPPAKRPAGSARHEKRTWAPKGAQAGGAPSCE